MGAFELGGVRWWPAAGRSPAEVRGPVAAALEALARNASANEKRGRRKELYRLSLGGGPDVTHLLKVNHYPERGGLRRRVFGSKARRELRLAERIAARGVATPLPTAAGERRERARVRTCYLLVPFLAEARDLRRVAAERLAPAERRALAQSFGEFARRLHDAGIDQDDFQPNNFLRLSAHAPELSLIDLERARLRLRLPARERARLLAKLDRELPRSSRGDRARFLRAYAGGDGPAWRSWWLRVAEAHPGLARRDGARIRRLLARPGRRFAPFAMGRWRGVRTGETDPDLVGRAFAALLGPGLAAGDEVAIVPAGAHFALAFSAPRDAAAVAFATAVLLGRRALGPRPTALLADGARALLLFEGALPRRLEALGAGERRALLPVLALLLDRLAALGALRAPRADLLGLSPAGAALPIPLLAPQLLRPGHPAARGGLAARRALAARILDVSA